MKKKEEEEEEEEEEEKGGLGLVKRTERRNAKSGRYLVVCTRV